MKDSAKSGSPATDNLIGKCPTATIELNGKQVKCILDSGAEVSTITESFYNKYLSDSKVKDTTTWMKISAANGLDIPFVGYIMAQVTVLGQTLDSVGIMVVKDPTDSAMQKRKQEFPGIVGSNIIHLLKNTQRVGQLDKLPPDWAKVLNLYEIKVDQKPANSVRSSVARSPGSLPIRIPAQSVQPVICTTNKHLEGEMLVEKLTNTNHLNPNLLVLDTYATVQLGHIQVAVVNIGDEDIWLDPHQKLGLVQPAEEVESEQEQYVIEEIRGSELHIRKASLEELECKVDEKLVTSSGSETEKSVVRDVLLKHGPGFTLSDEDEVGYTNLVKHPIPTIDDTLVCLPHRRVDPNLMKEAKANLHTWLKQGIIRCSQSDYASQAVLVHKPHGGGLRICLDFRLLNAKCRKDAYPIPRIDEALDALGGAKHFSKLDLAQGFLQCEVEEKDKHKTAFRVGSGGLYEFNRMPYGLTGAPATFQRLMELCLGDMMYDSVLCFMDDVLIYSKTFEEHVQKLDEVLTKLRQAGLKVKLKKCEFLMKEVTYLGHKISAAGVSTDPSKISAIENWKTPETEDELWSFLGLSG